MKAKALRIIALLVLALLTMAAPCPPDPGNTFYVVHEARLESGQVTLGGAVWIFSDQVDGLLTLQFPRDGAGNVVDGTLVARQRHSDIWVV